MSGQVSRGIMSKSFQEVIIMRLIEGLYPVLSGTLGCDLELYSRNRFGTMRRGFRLGLSLLIILFFSLMPGMAFSQDSGAPQEVTFQVYRTMTTDQGSWKQMCNHYTLTVMKDGTAVDLGTDGGVAEGTNGVLTIYLSPGDYSYQVHYNYPEYGQNPSQAGVTEGDFTVSEGKLNFVEVDTSGAPAPTPTSVELLTTIMHPTKAMLLLEDQIFNSTPEAPEAAAIKPHLTVQQYNAASGTSFSMLDYLSYNPHERSQGKCGNCWEWTSTGIMEIALDYKNGIKNRLSVQYLNSNMENDACCGGSIYKAAEFYENSKKAIPWENNNAQWQDQSSDCGSSVIPVSYISTSKNYPIDSINLEKIITQGVGKETAIEKIKAVLHSGKAIYFSFRLPNDDEWRKFEDDFWMGQSENTVWKPDLVCGIDYDEKNGGGAHAVLCIGYDDTDPNNRYWIMLNSWGAPPGRPNGLFYVDMDMNYDCKLSEINSFNFWTLDINYDLPPSVGPVAEPIRFTDHAMARGFDDALNAPEDRTDAFSTEDSAAFSAVKIGPVSGAHQMQWDWYSPDGALYGTYEGSISPSSQGAYIWEWSNLPIRDDDAENMPGDWRVEISLDGQPLLTERFSIARPGGYYSPIPSTLNVEVANDVYTPWDPKIYYCPSNGAMSIQNRIYLTGPDLNKVAEVTYILHPTFANPEISSNDASNSFEIYISAWGRFDMKAIITTKSGQVFEKSFEFKFADKVRDAQAMGVPMVQSC
jgi:C1A family cysteine protease